MAGIPLGLSFDFSQLVFLTTHWGNLAAANMMICNEISVNIADITFRRIVQNAAAVCHELKDFRYRGADGEWHYMYSVLNPMNPHPEKPYLVHMHAGKLISSLQCAIEKRERVGTYRVLYGYDPTKCNYTKYILYGTSKMIKRNFIQETINKESPEIHIKFHEGVDKFHQMIRNFYFMARISKYVSKVWGTSATANMFYKTARSGRDMEAYLGSKWPTVGTRFSNKYLGGPIASRFNIRGAGAINSLAAAKTNAFISRNITQKYVFLHMPKFKSHAVSPMPRLSRKY